MKKLKENINVAKIQSQANLTKQDVFDSDKDNSLKASLAEQRRLFQKAKCIGDEVLMRVAIENIKSDLKGIANRKGYGDLIRYVERVLYWYDTLSKRNIVNTPEGPAVRFPDDTNLKINKYFTRAYEKLMQIQYDNELT